MTGDEAEKLDRIVGEMTEDDWRSFACMRANGRCESCGNEAQLRASFIVPPDAGGNLLGSNVVALCRTCELASEMTHRDRAPASGPNTRPINIWVSRGLHARLQNGLSTRYGFRSVASLIRYLMTKYVMDSTRFEDVAQYQESGSDVKINVWVPRDTYEQFKMLADRNGLTVTDTLKGLIRMYELEIDRVVAPRLEGSDVR